LHNEAVQKYLKILRWCGGLGEAEREKKEDDLFNSSRAAIVRSLNL
jgi:hypothetical protein